MVSREVKKAKKNQSPPHFVACPTLHNHFNLTSPPLCSSKFHKYSNYDKAPNSFVLPPVPPDKPLRQAIHFPPGKTNFPRLQRHTCEHLLNRTFSESQANNQANLTVAYNQGIKGQVTAKDFRKEVWLCIKSLPQEAQCAKDVFQIQTSISCVNFSNNILKPQVKINLT